MAGDSQSELDKLALENTRLRKINRALMNQVERSYNQQGSAFSLFQTAIELEAQIKQRTIELTTTLRSLENSNLALQHAKESAEEANRSKTRYLAAASHDVLQPLNAAQLLLASLLESEIDSHSQRLAQQIQRSLNNMEDLLRTLLDISRLDAGVVEPVIEPVDVHRLFEDLHSEMAPIADQRNLTLRARKTELRVMSDRTILRRILQNILANALQYTNTGGVLLAARRRGNRVRIDVVDTGVGIEEPEIQSVFEEFHRGRHRGESTSQSAGLGLGLSIVKRMVNTLGHELVLRSRAGVGSTFSLLADQCNSAHIAKSTRQRDIGVSTATQPRGRRLLLIENDPAIVDAMTTLVQQWGYEVATAATASHAKSVAAEFGPEIIVADQHLDDHELGSNAIMSIREATERCLPAVIVTANPSDELSRLAKDAQIEMMTKPVKPAQLRALLNHLSGRAAKFQVVHDQTAPHSNLTN
ncbi:MAG: hybrid sensor histidine kinase/response regulator, partial [Pseudomonadota bacterium]